MNLFSSLICYSDFTTKSQLENFTTESLCYLLHYSIDNKTELAKTILSYFGITLTNYTSIEISTQKQYKVGRITVIPDITIMCNQVQYLVEVKVDSRFNRYTLHRKNIDQVELYSHIDNSKIITLTKCLRSESEVEHIKCYWYGIYSILNEYKSLNTIEEFLVHQFMCFLMENGMGTEKVEKDIDLTDAGKLFDQALSAIKEKFNNLSIGNIKFFFEPENEAIGFYFKHLQKQGYICLYANKKNQLFITLDDSSQQNEYSIHLTNEYFSKTMKEQIEFIKDNL